MEWLIGLATIVMALGIPIIAIWASHKQKMRKMELESGNGGDKELRKDFASLMLENELLQERIAQLESIVSELPQVSSEDRKKLKINIQPKEMSELEIEEQKLIDNK